MIVHTLIRWRWKLVAVAAIATAVMITSFLGNVFVSVYLSPFGVREYLMLGPGSVEVVHGTFESDDGRFTLEYGPQYVPRRSLARHLQVVSVGTTFGTDYRMYTIALWPCAVLPALLATVGLWTWQRRRSRGMCLRCAYPLTGATVCAECGQRNSPPS